MKSIFNGFGEIWGAMLAVFGAILRYLVRCCDFGWLVGLAVRAGCPRSVGMSKGGGTHPPPPRERDITGKLSGKKSRKFISKEMIEKSIGKYLLSTPRCPLKRAGG